MKIFAVFNYPNNGLQHHQKEVRSAICSLGTATSWSKLLSAPPSLLWRCLESRAASTPSTSTSSTKRGALLTYLQCPVSGTINTKGATHGRNI